MTEQLKIEKEFGPYFYEHGTDQWGVESFYKYQKGSLENVGVEYTEEQAAQEFMSNLLFIKRKSSHASDLYKTKARFLVKKLRRLNRLNNRREARKKAANDNDNNKSVKILYNVRRSFFIQNYYSQGKAQNNAN